MKTTIGVLLACVGICLAKSAQSSSSVPPTITGWANGAIYEGYLYNMDDDNVPEVAGPGNWQYGASGVGSTEVYGYASFKLNADNTFTANVAPFNGGCTAGCAAGGPPTAPTGTAYVLPAVVVNGLWQQTGDVEIRLQGIAHPGVYVLNTPPQPSRVVALTCDMAYDQNVGDFKVACGQSLLWAGQLDDPWAFRESDQVDFSPSTTEDGTQLTGSFIRRNQLVSFPGIYQPAAGESFVAAAFPELGTSSWSLSSTSFGEFSFSSYSNSSDDDDDDDDSSSSN